jgi:ribosome-associated translation inhibitor RaiA
MHIEINTGSHKIDEWIIDDIKNKLIHFNNSDKDINNAIVHLQENENSGNKICEIELFLFAEPIFVHQEAESFIEACRKAIEEITPLVNEEIKSRNQPTDEIVSTVDV